MRSILSWVVAIIAVVVGVEGKEKVVDETMAAELYESGIIHHRIMDMKHVRFLHFHDFFSWVG
jgi:hypothetical protein